MPSRRKSPRDEIAGTRSDVAALKSRPSRGPEPSTEAAQTGQLFVNPIARTREWPASDRPLQLWYWARGLSGP
jgi:hypothetical protein